MKRLKFTSSRPLLSHAILGAAIASTAVSVATPAFGFATGALRSQFSCDAGCTDAGDFYVLYGDSSMSDWSHYVGTHDSSGFYANQDYSNPHVNTLTKGDLSIAKRVDASFSDPVSPHILGRRTKHTLTNDNQYWAGIQGDDVNTWNFTDGHGETKSTTGFWAQYYSPSSKPNVLQLTVHNSTFTFDKGLLANHYDADGWLSLGVIAKTNSFNQVKWSVENGNSNLHAYEGWDMKNLKVDVPEPLTTTLATGLALGFGALFQKSSKKQKKGKLAT